MPYHESIDLLLKMKKIIPPLDKARCLVDMSSSIVHAINVFWEGLDINKEKLTIDGDSLLMIYIYVTVKSKFLDIFAQIKFINEFSTPFVRSTKLGYCSTTLEIAINHILMLTREDIFEKQGPEAHNTGDLNNLLHPDRDEKFFDKNNRSGSRASAWLEAHKSLRESVSIQSRAASLIIDPSALENPNFYRTSSKISNLSITLAAP